MERKIHFITDNEYKFQIAANFFENSGFEIIQKPLSPPEIQSDSLAEIASFSAKWSVKKLERPVFLTDAGCFIEALNGFPGPFVKYINQYLKAQDFLKLMEGEKNRKVVFKDCLAYCEPGEDPILFLSSASGKIASEPGRRGSTPINEIFIPQGFNRPESEISRESMIKFWNHNIKNLESLLNHLKNKDNYINN